LVVQLETLEAYKQLRAGQVQTPKQEADARVREEEEAAAVARADEAMKAENVKAVGVIAELRS